MNLEDKGSIPYEHPKNIIMTEEQFIEKLEKDSGVKYGDFGFIMGVQTPFHPAPEGNRDGFTVWKKETVIVNDKEKEVVINMTMNSISEEENLEAIINFLKIPLQRYIDMNLEMNKLAKEVGFTVSENE